MIISGLAAMTGAEVDQAADLALVVDMSQVGDARDKKMTFAELLIGILAMPLSYLDTDGALAANSDAKVPSQKAIRSYIASKLTGMFDLRGSTDCSANPNYPAAVKGDTYVVTVGGKIGGAGGTTVAAGDIYFATADNAGGTQAAVGASWDVILHAGTLSGALLAANNLSDVASVSTARTNLGLGAAALLATAVAADVQAGTSTTRAVTPSALAGSAAVQTLTDAATIAWDMSVGYNAKVTLGASRILGTPTNPIAGQTYTLAVAQDATGTRLMTWPASFDWGTTGAPTLTTTASKVDQITLMCTDAATPKFRAYLSGKGFGS